jgi:hypothetical protein
MNITIITNNSRNTESPQQRQPSNAPQATAFSSLTAQNRTSTCSVKMQRRTSIRYRESYTSVASENRTAVARSSNVSSSATARTLRRQRSAGQSTHTHTDASPVSSSDGKKIAEKLTQRIDTLRQQNSGAGAETSDQQEPSALVLIKKSIITLTTVFNLKLVDDVESLEKIDIENIPPAMIEQFAEILDTLIGIKGVLEKTLAGNEQLTLDGAVVEDENTKQMLRVVRMEVFRLEMAFSMMHISGDVLDRVAAKHGHQLPAELLNTTGIPTAIDPAQKQMSAIDLNQVLQSSQNNSGDSMDSSVVDMLKKAIVGFQQALHHNGEAAQNISISFSEGEQNRPMEMLSMDSMILRKILNIDSSGEINKENTTPIVTGSQSEIPSVSNVFSGQEFPEQFMAQSGEKDSNPDNLSFQMSEIKNHTVFSPKTPEMAWKVLEISVMQQVVERVHATINHGANEIRMRLHPDNLGEVHLKIQVENDVVMAKIRVENQQVKQIIENNFQSLRDALAEHNMQAGDFDVNVNSHDNDTAQQSGQSASNPVQEDEPAEDSEHTDDSESSSQRQRRYHSESNIEYLI